METFDVLNMRLTEYHKKNGYIVGQISMEKLELFYSFILKGIQALNETKQQENFILKAYVEGETREEEDYDTNRFYCGPYTYVHFYSNQFSINRTEPVSKQEECNYLGGLLRLELSSKSCEAIVSYIAKISSIANVYVVIPKDKNPDSNTIYIYRKDLKLIASGEFNKLHLN